MCLIIPDDKVMTQLAIVHMYIVLSCGWQIFCTVVSIQQALLPIQYVFPTLFDVCS